MLLSFRKSLDKLSGKSIAITNSKLFKMLLMFGCGSLMGITFAPIGAWYFAWVALAPLWYLLCRDRHSGSVIYPLCWGIGCYGFALGWIFGIHPMTWLGVPFLASLSIAIFCLGFVTLWGGSLVILWSQLMRLINIKLNLNPLIRIILATAGWCGLETIYSWTDLWWTSLSLSQSPHNLAILHLGQLSGPNAVSAAIVFVNGLIAEAYLAYTQTDHQINQSQRERLALRYFSGAIAAILILHLVGWQLVDRPLLLNPKSAIEVGIIQGNIGNGIKHRRSGNELSIDNYTKGYRSLVEQGAKLVVTPETALPFTQSQIKNTALYQAILEKKVPAFIGGFGETPAGLTNSILTISKDGTVLGRYDKWKLVPLGEYIPFEEALGKLIAKISPLDAHLVGGKSGISTMTEFGHIIFGICYDSAYSEHFRRQAQTGGLIITASNDSYFTPGMQAQHHAQDLMRAIETDRWVVRATNTGHSGIIDPHGHTRWISELNQFTTHVDRVYRQYTQTLYVRFGDWLTPLLGSIGLFLFIRTARISSRQT